LVSKYADHLPLYRQSGIYARQGVELERSTLADWVGSAARLLAPLEQALGRHVLAAEKLHADDTPVDGAAARARHDEDRTAVDLRARRPAQRRLIRRRCGCATRRTARASTRRST
jgi:transposase